MIRRFKKYYNINNTEVVLPPPPPPEDAECTKFILEASLDTNIVFTYLNCLGGTSNVTVPGNSSITVCAKGVYPPTFSSNKWNIYVDDFC